MMVALGAQIFGDYEFHPIQLSGNHLAIGRNIPLPQVVAWLCGLAPRGVIEFVRKDDPTVQQMLSLREDIFPDGA